MAAVISAQIFQILPVAVVTMFCHNNVTDSQCAPQLKAICKLLMKFFFTKSAYCTAESVQWQIGYMKKRRVSLERRQGVLDEKLKKCDEIVQMSYFGYRRKTSLCTAMAAV